MIVLLRYWLFAGCLCLTTSLFASSFSHAQPPAAEWNIPGGVVDIRWPKRSAQIPTVKFGLTEPVILDAGQHWRALIGLGLDTLPGEYLLYIKPGDAEEPAFELQFDVRQQQYSLVAGSEPSTNTPSVWPLSELDFSNSVPPSIPLKLPVDTEWDDEFGQLRVYDNQVSAQQSYLELTAPTNATQVVQAPQNGIVSRVVEHANTDASGEIISTVYIDHGRGLYSILSGLTDLTVELGNGVVAGAVIGKMAIPSDNAGGPANAIASSVLTAAGGQPATRATDTRLRWQCVLNGVFVNPLILTEIQ